MLTSNTTKSLIPKKYWAGEGRKIIVIPPHILKKQKTSNALLSGLYIAELGYYPTALGHYTHRRNGSADNILIYCVKGQGLIKIAGIKYTVSPNSFFVLPRNVEHEFGALDNNPWTIYWVKFGGDGLSNFNELAFVKDTFKPRIFPNNNEAVELFNEIFMVLEQGYSTQYLVYINMLFVTFLTLLFFQHTPLIKKETANPHDNITQKAIGHMKLNLSKSVTIHDLANASGCSVSHVCNIFKLSTGYSPIDYFIQLKIQKACQHLYSTNMLVKEIAADLGYADQYYFSRLFTQLMGVSPNHYRLSRKNDLESKKA